MRLGPSQLSLWLFYTLSYLRSTHTALNLPPSNYLQLCLRNTILPEAVRQAGLVAVSISVGSPVTWAVARHTTMTIMACCVTAASELKTRHLFLMQRAAQPPGAAGGTVEGGPAGSKPKSA